jgi:tRNA(Leu) C34 or U34 (ribose-2'-O)-methylase TrmL
MEVCLYRVGRNINRAYRTCEAFGVTVLSLYACTGTVQGALFRAAGRVRLENRVTWPPAEGTVALETTFLMPLWQVPWSTIERLVLGGETHGLPAQVPAQYHVTIPQYGSGLSLTVEATLAIALYVWKRALCLHAP